MGHLRHHVGDQSPIRGREQILVRMFVRSKPVREVGPDAFGAQEIRVPALDKLHPALHRIPVFFNDGPVAVLQPCRPRNNHSRITPAGRADYSFVPGGRAFGFASAEWKCIGGYIGKCALSGLSIHDVLNEFLRKRGDVEVIASGSPENSCISHPTQTFVALRTIGGYAQEISALTPDANQPHLIDQIT